MCSLLVKIPVLNLVAGLTLCLYPTTKCKSPHIHYSVTDSRKKTPVLTPGSNAVLIDAEMCCYFTHVLLELQMEGQSSLQCGRNTECTKNIP